MSEFLSNMAKWLGARRCSFQYAGILLIALPLLAASDPLRASDNVRVEERIQLGEGGTVSIDFVDTEIDAVLRMIAKVTGLNIVAGEEITGKVTARFEKVAVGEALMSILRSCGYTYVEEGDVFRIMKLPEDLIGVGGTTPQVLIESRIIEVTLGKEEEAGINWNLLSSKLDSDLEMTGEIKFVAGTSGLILNVFSGDAEALVQLLKKETNTNILSAPRVVASDNREAKILVGERIAYQQSFGQVNAGITTTSVEFEDVGVKLYVTPHVRTGDCIILDILVEVSSVKEWRSLSNGDEVPIISTKETTSRVIVRNNETLIFGGLIGEDQVETIWKVPVLGEIPLIKYLFRRRNLELNKKELTVLITPRIMAVTPGVVGLSGTGD